MEEGDGKPVPSSRRRPPKRLNLKVFARVSLDESGGSYSHGGGVRTATGRQLEIRLRGCKSRPKPLQTEFQRKRRLTWAREHSLWTIKDWEKVIFSDESQSCIYGNQSRVYVRRRTHEEFSPQCLKPTVKYPTKVMVWGCMSSHGVGRLHIVSGTVKAMNYIEILQNKFLPTPRDLFGNQPWIFQDDNTPCHRAKIVQK
ncbi:transposable element Tcb1 transposase [Trichonephila clavipes]|nr:transposable element Tcb1 transposase [Trichonephila clavipes]